MTAVTLIIDASALVKLIVREPDSGYYESCVGDETRLIAPAHMLAETGEVLSRKMRAGHVDEKQLARIVDQLRTEIDVIDVLDLLERAVVIAVEVGASVYDCLYVAAAERLNAKLLTADRRLAIRLQGTRFSELMIPLDSSTGPP